MTTQTLREDLGGRRFDLDWVRILAFMALILYHVGMYYVSWDWHVKSPHASHDIEPLMMLTSPWRLSLLFLVSGVATAYLLARTPKGFLGGRSVRLLIPLAFGMAIIVPPQSYLEVVEKLGYPGSYLDFYKLYLTAYHGFCRGQDCLILPTWNHLWFVIYLWVYTLIIFLSVKLLPRWVGLARGLAEKHLSGVLVVLLPVAYLIASRFILGTRFPQTHALIGDWYNHANYFFVFVAGFVLAGTEAPWKSLEKMRWHTLGCAVLCWALFSAYMSAYQGDAEPPQVLVIFCRSVYGALQWLAIASVLGFARKHLNRDNAARRYLTTAIFPVYILHQTVIVIVAHALKPAELYAPVEGLLLVMVTAASCFLGYELIRRVAPLKPLFGLALERRVKAPREDAPVIAKLSYQPPHFFVPQDVN